MNLGAAPSPGTGHTRIITNCESCKATLAEAKGDLWQYNRQHEAGSQVMFLNLKVSN